MNTVEKAPAVKDEAQSGCAMRVSMGWNTPDDAGVRFLAAWAKELNWIVGRTAA